ncbi:MAG: hypothetical protein QMD11_09415, partial [Smithella sp.]|nr:hypothetical protein [Smithella sp.]
MTPDIPPAKIPVVVLYNIDPEWTKEEKDEVIRLSTELNDALQKTDYPTVAVAIENDDMAADLRAFDPAGHIIFNWCEGLPGVKNSEWLVV